MKIGNVYIRGVKQYTVEELLANPGLDPRRARRTIAIGKPLPKNIKKLNNSKEWGPPAWKALHDAAAAGELNQTWLHKFTYTRVPCGECRQHWLGLLQKFPLDVKNQYEWSVMIHNEVNKRLGKPIWSPEQNS